MEQIPGRLLQHIREFSADLRAQLSVGQNTAIDNYRGFLRGNVVDVISKTFPLFSQRVGKERVQQLTDQYLAAHGAEEAEFHHIATEVLCFLQKSDDLPPELLTLVEYEWLLFYVEIDPNVVPGSAEAAVYSVNERITRVVLNPTLKCIHLPGSILQGQGVNQETQTYGLFRNQDDEVMKKSLTSFDHTLLHLLVDKKIIWLIDLQNSLPAQDVARLAEWIEYNKTIDFISLQT